MKSTRVYRNGISTMLFVLLVACSTIPTAYAEWSAALVPSLDETPASVAYVYLPVTLNRYATIQVARIVDGDTIYVRIDGEVSRLHYIGIDTPEEARSTMRRPAQS